MLGQCKINLSTRLFVHQIIQFSVHQIIMQHPSGKDNVACSSDSMGDFISEAMTEACDHLTPLEVGGKTVRTDHNSAVQGYIMGSNQGS